jgi:hypothetical protein
MAFCSLRLRQPLIAWARRAVMKRNSSRYRTWLRSSAGGPVCIFILRSLHIFRPPDRFLTHCEQIDALVLLPILEINETGTI